MNLANYRFLCTEVRFQVYQLQNDDVVPVIFSSSVVNLSQTDVRLQRLLFRTSIYKNYSTCTCLQLFPSKSSLCTTWYPLPRTPGKRYQYISSTINSCQYCTVLYIRKVLFHLFTQTGNENTLRMGNTQKQYQPIIVRESKNTSSILPFVKWFHFRKPVFTRYEFGTFKGFKLRES